MTFISVLISEEKQIDLLDQSCFKWSGCLLFWVNSKLDFCYIIHMSEVLLNIQKHNVGLEGRRNDCNMNNPPILPSYQIKPNKDNT